MERREEKGAHVTDCARRASVLVTAMSRVKPCSSISTSRAERRPESTAFKQPRACSTRLVHSASTCRVRARARRGLGFRTSGAQEPPSSAASRTEGAGRSWTLLFSSNAQINRIRQLSLTRAV